MLPGLSLSVLLTSPLLQRYASQGKYIGIFSSTHLINSRIYEQRHVISHNVVF